eukprot:TRINITY_DN7691_c0_g5_i3.p2 TRINITY_DN7691_c0_g5~~TRINITY_DN7691_c0_g5_i3.p2  ORF type:complete len:153 (+),score=41.62 TRINITY_DN7691_c0_g5_i3:1861-2319(+)
MEEHLVITINSPPVLFEKHKLREAIDFHCYPSLINKCLEIVSGFTASDVSSAVWWHRSSINNKKFVCLATEPYHPVQPFTDDPKEQKFRKETEEKWNMIKDTWTRLTGQHYWRPIQQHTLGEVKEIQIRKKKKKAPPFQKKKKKKKKKSTLR